MRKTENATINRRGKKNYRKQKLRHICRNKFNNDLESVGKFETTVITPENIEAQHILQHILNVKTRTKFQWFYGMSQSMIAI